MKQTRSILVLALTAAVLTGCQNSSHVEKAEAVGLRPTREYAFTYEVTVPAPPAGTSSMDVWVPLPMTDPGVQTVSDLVIMAPEGYETTQESRYGNKMLYCRIDNPTGPTKITWKANITRHADVGQGSLPSSDAYIMGNDLIPIEGQATARAKELGVDQETIATTTRARTIYDDVLDEMAYDKVTPGWGRGDLDHAMTVCTGNCTDFHSRFIGVARASKIPTRFTMGIPLKPKKMGTYNSYHCWAHYMDDGNWKPVDISEADKVVATDPMKANRFFGHLDPDRLALSFGRDVVLSPAQKGAPLNYFVFPYAEVDGKAFEALNDKSNWTFTYEDI